jgi:hypothetical protein
VLARRPLAAEQIRLARVVDVELRERLPDRADVLERARDLGIRILGVLAELVEQPAIRNCSANC